MASTLDCVICLMRQSLEAARFATKNEEMHAQILERVMKLFIERGVTASPPIIGTVVHRVVREITGDDDPYAAEKRRFNRDAYARWDDIQRSIKTARDPFEAAVRLAIAGNSIDFALESINEEKINAAIANALDAPLRGSIDALRDAILAANSILYLTDNAGEIVYDKAFVELLATPQFEKSVTVATRGAPIINDALRSDAEEIGFDKIARLVDNGGDGLGTIFELTSEEFNREFLAADLVIAKGLANYETLAFPQKNALEPKKIAFLFKAKCPFIAREAGADLGDLIIKMA